MKSRSCRTAVAGLLFSIFGTASFALENIDQTTSLIVNSEGGPKEFGNVIVDLTVAPGANDFLSIGVGSNTSVVFEGSVYSTNRRPSYTAENFRFTEINSKTTFSGEKAVFNTLSNAGVIGINANLPYGKDPLPTTLEFTSCKEVTINSIITKEDGIGRTNVTGIQVIGGNPDTKLVVDDTVGSFTVNTFGSGIFNGNSGNTNGTAGIYVSESTVEVNSKTFNVNSTAGQNYTATYEVAPGKTETVSVKFDQATAEALGTDYSVTYGIKNNGIIKSGGNTTVNVNVSDGFWSAVGIQNDGLYVDQDLGFQTDYSQFHKAEIALLGDINVNVSGASLGSKAGDSYTGAISYKRPLGTFGVYASTTELGKDLPLDQVTEKKDNLVILGSKGHSVNISVKDLSKSDKYDDVKGIFGKEAAITVQGSTNNIIAESNGDSYAVDLTGKSTFNLGSTDSVSNIVAVSHGGKAIGLQTNDSVANLSGIVNISAETALAGNGTVNVLKDAYAVFDGEISEKNWTGVLNVEGKAAYSMTQDQIGSSLSDVSGSALLLAAGTTVAGTINVGALNANADNARAASSNTLTVASDGKVLIKALEGYDGSSPLVVVDKVDAAKGSSVVLLNATAVKEGTTVFAVKDDDSIEDYLFSTDNLLKQVVDNKVVTAKAETVFGGDILIPNSVNFALMTDGLAKDRIEAITTNATTQQATTKLNAIALMGTASGTQTMAVNIANTQLNTIDSHGSMLAGSAHDRKGADLWIDVNGSFSKARHYSAGSVEYGYRSDISGITVGSDYSFGNGLAAGLAANFGKGSLRGQNTGAGIKNNIDYFGFNLYGVWSNPYVNLIGSVGYLQSNNEIKSQGYKAKPNGKTFVAGIRAEKPFAVTVAVKVTPHVGLRYKHVKIDDFNAGGFSYRNESANLFELPVGVAVSSDIKTAGGAEIKPFVDVTVAPNFGDRKVKNKVGLRNTAVSDSFDARITNNALVNGTIGVNAVKGSHSFGLHYSVGGGNDGRVDQMLKAKYSYQF